MLGPEAVEVRWLVDRYRVQVSSVKFSERDFRFSLRLAVRGFFLRDHSSSVHE